MKSEEARKIVNLYSFADDAYTQSMEALHDKYGSPRKIFPILHTVLAEAINEANVSSFRYTTSPTLSVWAFPENEASG